MSRPERASRQGSEQAMTSRVARVTYFSFVISLLPGLSAEGDRGSAGSFGAWVAPLNPKPSPGQGQAYPE